MKIANKKLILYIDRFKRYNGALDSIDDNDNYFVLTTFSSKEAIAKANAFSDKIDLLLINMRLTEIYGEQMYDMLCKNIFLRDIPVIFQIPGLVTRKGIHKLIKAGKAEIIFKPYTKEELFKVIDDLYSRFGDRTPDKELEEVAK